MRPHNYSLTVYHCIECCWKYYLYLYLQLNVCYIIKMHCMIFFLATSGSEGDNTAAVSPAIVGGVLGTLLILSVTVIMIVTVTCLLKNHRGNDTCKKYVYMLNFV